MKIMHYSEAKATQFDDSDNVHGVTGRVVIGKTDGANNFCMRFFELTEGGFSPRHFHEWEHEILIHSGQGEVLSEGAWVPVTTGFTIFIPGNEEHQLRNTGATPLIFACMIPSGVPEL